MRNRKKAAGGALPKTDQLGYVAPLPDGAAIAHLQRAVRMFGNPSKFAKACGVPQPSLWYILNGQRRVYAEMAVVIEAVTGGEVARWQLRPDLWDEPEGGLDVTHLIGVPDDDAYNTAFREFQEAHALAGERPCIRTWRAAVIAFDKYRQIADLL